MILPPFKMTPNKIRNKLSSNNRGRKRIKQINNYKKINRLRKKIKRKNFLINKIN